MWGIEEESGDFFTKYEELESHLCTRAELGLEDPGDSKFFPLDKNSREIIEMKHM